MRRRPFRPLLRIPARLLFSAEPASSPQCRLRYSVEEPFTVRVECLTDTGQGARSWTVARDLLAAGTSSPQGTDGWRIWPSRRQLTSRRRLYFSFDCPAERVTFETDHAEVCRWLSATYDLVPWGAEHELIDWDSLERQLLRQGD